MSGLAGLRRTLAIGGAGLVIMTGACGAPAPRADQSPTPSVVPTVAGTSLSAPPTTPATPSQPPVESRRREVTVVMNGDLLWHNTLWYGAREDARRRGKRGYDFAPALARLRPVVAGADLAICHQEVPIGRSDRPYRNFPRFAVPRQVVSAIKATGYDVCTTASNHSVDRGFAGLKRTLDELDRAGIEHAGTARTRREADRSTIVTTKQGIQGRGDLGHVQPERPAEAARQTLGGQRARSRRACGDRPGKPGRPVRTSCSSRRTPAPSTPQARTPSNAGWRVS